MHSAVDTRDAQFGAEQYPQCFFSRLAPERPHARHFGQTYTIGQDLGGFTGGACESTSHGEFLGSHGFSDRRLVRRTGQDQDNTGATTSAP